jgi:hypothetical protein
MPIEEPIKKEQKNLFDMSLREFYTTDSIKKLDLDVDRIIRRKGNLDPNMKILDFYVRDSEQSGAVHRNTSMSHEEIKCAIMNSVVMAYPSESHNHTHVFAKEIDAEWDKLKNANRKFLCDHLNKEDWDKEFPTHFIGDKINSLSRKIVNKLQLEAGERDAVFKKVEASLLGVYSNSMSGHLKASEIANAVYGGAGRSLNDDRKSVFKNYVVSVLKNLPKEI